MNNFNPCTSCIGKENDECCQDVFIILNPNEIHFFKEIEGFVPVNGGGIFSTKTGCPYLKNYKCIIHSKKPQYCKYYPIFITGNPYMDTSCAAHVHYSLSEKTLEEIKKLQEEFPIYQLEWLLEDVEKLYSNTS